MKTAFSYSAVIRARRALLLVAVLAAALVSASSASAAPSWQIGALHKNLYGVGALTSPYSGSGESFARESGANAYSIQVTNKSLGAGVTLSCSEGTWSGATGFEYQWYRNGAAIAGAASSTYTTQAADLGSAVQCAVTATNAGPGKAVKYSTPRQVGSTAGQVSLPRQGELLKIEASAGGATGSVLTCNPEFGWRWPTFTYQWLKNGAPIGGATAKTYTIAGGDAPAAIQCAVTATNSAGSVVATTAAQVTSTAPSPAAPTSSAAPRISGGSEVAGGSLAGQKLSCASTPSVAEATVGYQWLRNGTPIGGATSSSYIVTGADAGAVLQCRVTAALTDGSTVGFSIGQPVSPAPVTAAPVAATPTVTGTASVGVSLSCATGSWTGAPSFSYQWLRNGTPIGGATSSTYSVAVADLATNVQCQVTGTNAGGSVVAASAAKIINGPIPVVSAAANNPTISGSPTVGSELTCNNGTWSNSPTFSWEWLRNGTPIGGATAQKYTVTVADEGKVLQCRVTGTNAQAVVKAMSAGTVVAPAPGTTPPTLTTAGTVTGTVAIGSELTCNAGTWANTPTSFSYQWLRNGEPISGASLGSTTETSFKYKLALADLGKAVQCQVTATNAGGSAVAINAVTAGVKFVAPRSLTAPTTLTAPGSINVAIQLPPGMVISGVTENGFVTLSSTDDAGGFLPGPFPRHPNPIVALGWSCDLTSYTCSRSDALQSGESYPPIVVHVRVEDEAADTSTPVFAVTGGGGNTTSVSDPTEVVPAVPFGFAKFTAALKDEAGNYYGQAGGHPFSGSTDLRANVTPRVNGNLGSAGGDPRELMAELPAGFSANPQNFPQCPAQSLGHNGCPENTVIGFIKLSFVSTNGATIAEGSVRYEPYWCTGCLSTLSETAPLYNLRPEPGSPAQFGFNAYELPYLLSAEVRSDGDYGINIGVKATPAQLTITAAEVTICAHGAMGVRNSGTGEIGKVRCASTPGTAIPFINNASKCAGEAPPTTLHGNSYQQPGQDVEMTTFVGAGSAPYSYFGHSTSATPVAESFLTGCQQLTEQFKPTIKFQPDNTRADSPVGYDVTLHIPQSKRQDTLMAPPLKKTVVKLPEGTTFNASAANGLGACTTKQIGLIGTGFPAPNPIRFDKKPIQCPASSRVATLEVESPLLSEPLDGDVYLAKQGDNPFGTDFAIYLGIDDAKTGLVIKLPGEIVADHKTGQLTAIFDNNPQLPLENFRLHFFPGPQAALANPATCGEKTTTSEIVPWSAADPDHPTPAEISTPTDSFEVESDPEGGACAPSASQLPFKLGFEAGAKGTQAGASNPFSFRITRPDGSQELEGLALKTPPGVSASLKGIPRCTDAQMKEAEGKTGTEELAHSSCPAASQVGSTLVGSGAGSNPYYSSGKLYLAGPYKGAPVSVVSITPAVAGPFDLGNVVLRTAVFIDRSTAQVTAKTDPIPHILDGVALRIRDVRVKLDRKDWTINPTSCDASSVAAKVQGVGGATANLSTRFQVGGCEDLAFGPKLSGKLTGGTQRGDHPAFTAEVNFPAGQANTRDVQVALPHSEFLDQSHINTICTRVQAAANACPQGSIYGYAEAESPLLDGKLTGPVFLKSSDHQLPDLAIALKGPENQPIEVEFAGRIDSIHAQIRNTIEGLPDVPVTKFVLRMKGGRKGLLVNSRDLCKGRVTKMTVKMVGQNNKQSDSRPPLTRSCSGRASGKAKKGKVASKRQRLSLLAAIW